MIQLNSAIFNNSGNVLEFFHAVLYMINKIYTHRVIYKKIVNFKTHSTVQNTLSGLSRNRQRCNRTFFRIHPL